MTSYRIKKQTAPSFVQTDYIEFYVDTVDSAFKYRDETGLVHLTVGVNAKGTLAALTALPREEGKLYYATDTEQLYTDDGVSLTSTEGASVGINTLTDVEAASPIDKQRLVYNLDSAKWKNTFRAPISTIGVYNVDGVQDSINVEILSNSTSFGTDNIDRDNWSTCCASKTRLVYSGGSFWAGILAMSYNEFSTGGAASFFGNLIFGPAALQGGTGDTTRGLLCQGEHAGASFGVPYDETEYITYATLGNATFFGNSIHSNRSGLVCSSSPTRAICWGGGGVTAGGAATNVIEYFTIQTTSNTTDFGDLNGRTTFAGFSVSNSIRSVQAGGNATSNAISYVTMATTSNASAFGVMSTTRWAGGGASSTTRGVFMGGSASGSPAAGLASMEYVTIPTTSNSSFFGNLVMAVSQRSAGGGGSNGHGGLQ